MTWAAPAHTRSASVNATGRGQPLSTADEFFSAGTSYKCASCRVEIDITHDAQRAVRGIRQFNGQVPTEGRGIKVGDRGVHRHTHLSVQPSVHEGHRRRRGWDRELGNGQCLHTTSLM